MQMERLTRRKLTKHWELAGSTSGMKMVKHVFKQYDGVVRDGKDGLEVMLLKSKEK